MMTAGSKWLLILFACAVLPLASAGHGTSAPQAAEIAAPEWPVPLEMQVPVEPTAFPSNGRTYLTYELYLRNWSNEPVTVERIDVFAEKSTARAPMVTLEHGSLNTALQRIGDPIVGDQIPDSEDNSRRTLNAGGSLVVYLWIVINPGAPVPARLRHRVTLTDSTAEGALIGTHHAQLRVLGPPVSGTGWVAGSGPSNDSHHRRGIFVSMARATISRRYAIDWIRLRNGATFSGDSGRRESYFAYGQPVLAVADATVVAARADLPDNSPGHAEDFHPAAPIRFDTVAGNHITLDLGGGHFAHYFHLQPGTVHLHPGSRVRRGEVLGRIGSSGDAREPHLHFEITTSPEEMAGEGVPYLLEQYWVPTDTGAVPVRHVHELPLGNTPVDFADGR